MIVLGLNGWTDRTHDPSAALIIDGRVEAFIEQERLSRRKHGVSELAHEAVAAVLAETSVVPSQLDGVAYGWDLAKYNGLRQRTVDLTDAASVLTGLYKLRTHEVTWTNHHDAHAASTFYGSGLSEAAVVVVDAEGENESASLYHATLAGLRPIRRFGRGVSLGLMYRAVSEYCGFGQFGSGKTMALASYHTDNVEPLPLMWDDGDLSSPFPADAWEDDILSGWKHILVERYGPPGASARRDSSGSFPPLDAHRPAAAAAAQATVNSVMAALVREAMSLTNCRNVCLAGGVALNCVANGLLLEEVNILHIPPYPHDAGVALGAAQLMYIQSGNLWRDQARATVGTDVKLDQVEKALKSGGYPVHRVSDPAATACQLLQDGYIIGWVQGRMEIGPRALGQRSILALPGNRRIRDRVNMLKGRELWRPLAPSVLSEDVHFVFGRELESPFMLVSIPMSNRGQAVAPAAAHIDGSARLQTVAKDGSLYRRLLEYVREATGTGIMLNTSFNARDEPIVRTPEEALATALRIGLDAIVIGDVLVRFKPESAHAC
jgi:carbamoyltransferase